MLKILIFYQGFVEQILSGKKTTTIRKSTNIVAGDIFNLRVTDGDVFATGKCKRIYLGVRIEKDGSGTLSGDHDRTMRILMSEGFDWEKLVKFIKAEYGLPFHGVVIEFEVIK